MANDISEAEKFVRSKLPEWFIKAHMESVVSEAKYLLRFYPHADKEIVIVGAWLHDVGHVFGKQYYDDKGEILPSVGEHHIVGAKLAEDFLKSINYPKIKEVVHCVLSHRTSKPPAPETIEAKIVASADNLAHFAEWETLLQRMGTEKALMKVKRDISSDFMLPEATKRAKELAKRYKINIF